jgi:hypothetical protein
MGSMSTSQILFVLWTRSWRHFALHATGGAVVALMCLSLAAPFALAQTSTTARLQPLVNDAVAQLKISYRHDQKEQEARYEAIGQAVSAWKQSPRQAADNERLAAWLRSAMQASMPGSHQPLPALPKFGAAASDEVIKNSKDLVDSPAVVHESTVKPQPGGGATPTETPADQVSAVEKADSAEAHTVEAHKPIAADEGDPFRDDPLPNEN